MNTTLNDHFKNAYPVTRAGLTWNQTVQALELAMGNPRRSRRDEHREPDTTEHRISA